MSARVENWVNRVWYGNSRWYLLLLPLSWIYGFITGSRRALYRHGFLRTYNVGVPIVVVGNITAGGTGKTPIAIMLAQELRHRGFSPGIVSRGYRGDVGAAPIVVDVDSDPDTVGEEAALMARHGGCPVVVHPDRVAAAGVLKQQGVDVIIADDGLQHGRLERDVEIAVVDGKRMHGNQHLLPAGPLREPIARLSSVQHVLLQTEDGAARIPGVADDIPVSVFLLRPSAIHRLDDSESRAVDTFEGQRVHAVAAIGNPDRFFDLLTTLGMDVVRHVFPDHATLTAEDLSFDGPSDVIMTEKDAVKCKRLAADNRWYLAVEAMISDSSDVPLIDQVEKLVTNHD